LFPFTRTTDAPSTNPVPFTVSVKEAPPAVADVGVMPVVVGAGFGKAVIVKVCALDVPPPGAGLTTVTDAPPIAAMSAAVIVALSWFAEPKLVVRVEPFQRTVAPFTKLLPATVSENPALPATADDGERLDVAGTGLLTASVCVLDVPPPGAGVNTVIDALPALAISAAVIAAVNWVDEPKVVVRLLPFMRTTDEPFTKPVPFTVSEKDAPPAVTDVGEMLVVVGAGFVDVMVKVCALDVPPPGVGVNTVTEPLPALAISAAVMVAVNCVDEPKVVVRLEPFQRTTDVDTKPVPFTVKVKAALPAAAEVGEMLVVVGTGADPVVAVTWTNDATDGTPFVLIRNNM
jgi:hypothetical protein